jgi:membrane-bound lytic murein transglycosylase F
MVKRMFSAKQMFCKAMLMAACCVCGADLALARGLEQILQTGELRACIAPVTPSYATFEDEQCREDCRVSGPVPRVVRAFVDSLGQKVRPVFHRLEWDQQFHNSSGVTVLEGEYTPHHLQSEHCDIYPSHLTKNAWRQKKMDFVVLFPNRMMVITLKKRLSEFQSEADLAGKNIAVAQHTSLHGWAREQNRTVYRDDPMILVLIPHGQELPTVAAGNADFTVLDAEVSLWESTQRYTQMGVALPVGEIDEIGWGLRKQDQDLRRAVQDFFNAQIADETSTLNKVWKEEYGLSLGQFHLLIQATR